MAVDYIRRGTDLAPNQSSKQAANPIFVDSDTDTLKFGTGTSGTTVKEVGDTSSTQTLTGKTLTAPVITSPNITGGTSLTADTTIDATYAGRIITLDKTTGLAVTLPAATGTRNKFEFIVGTALASGSYVIKVANSTDFFRGTSFVAADDATGSAKAFSTSDSGTVATESDTLTLNGSTQSGYIGTRVEIVDIAAATFSVKVLGKATGTEISPFTAGV